jgi:hypothetical protein
MRGGASDVVAMRKRMRTPKNIQVNDVFALLGSVAEDSPLALTYGLVAFALMGYYMKVYDTRWLPLAVGGAVTATVGYAERWLRRRQRRAPAPADPSQEPMTGPR